MNKFRNYPLAAAGFVILAVVGSLCSNALADNTAVAQRWIAFWNAHDASADAVAAVFTDDAFYEDVPSGSENHGIAEISAFAEFFFTAVPDLKVELVDNFPPALKGGHGTIEWIYSGTDVELYQTGNQFAVRGVSVIDVEGEKISRNSDYYDLATILRQLGLLPPGL
jgi:steroid delta-isomerase-like uncharacterized protein